MTNRKIGMITIGQSPREDIVPEIKGILGEGWMSWRQGPWTG